MDTQGILLTVRIDGANEQEGERFLKMFQENPINSLSIVWADSAYRRLYLKEALGAHKIKRVLDKRAFPRSIRRFLGSKR